MIGSVAGCAQCDVPLAEDLVFTGPKASLNRTVALATRTAPPPAWPCSARLTPVTGPRRATVDTTGHPARHAPARPPVSLVLDVDPRSRLLATRSQKMS